METIWTGSQQQPSSGWWVTENASFITSFDAIQGLRERMREWKRKNGKGGKMREK